jgi:hypothetical protein
LAAHHQKYHMVKLLLEATAVMGNKKSETRLWVISSHNLPEMAHLRVEQVVGLSGVSLSGVEEQAKESFHHCDEMVPLGRSNRLGSG